MRPVFDLKVVLRMLTVSAVAGISALMFLPLLALGMLSSLVVSFSATLISVPLIWYFVDVPEGSIDVEKYRDSKTFTDVTMDIVLVFISSMTPSAIFMYFMLSFGMMGVVAVSSAAALGIFTGLSAFIFRNRALFSKTDLDIDF